MSHFLLVIEHERNDALPTRLAGKLNTTAFGEGISRLSYGVWLIDPSKGIRFLAETIDDAHLPVKCRVLRFDTVPEEMSLS